MGSAHTLVRVRGDDGRWRAARPGERGERRYLVRWRLGGRESRLRHGGSFPTRREAEARERYIRDELAAGRVPESNPGRAMEGAPTVEAVVRAHIAARVDVGEGTRDQYGYQLARLPADLRALPVPELTAGVLQAWVNGEVAAGRYGAAAIARPVRLLRRAFAQAGLDGAAAAVGRVTVPSYQAPEVRPPSAAEALALVRSLPERWRGILMAIEGSGMRCGEAARLLGRDVDRAGGRLLVRRERTKRGTAGERWIPLRPATLALVPDAPPDRPVWGGFAPAALRDILRVRTTPERRITPHSFRHRYASRLVAQGLPITVVRERLGHTRASMTLDVYAHVLLDDDHDPLLDLADLIGGGATG